ncbi:MAG: tyrosine-type recombinase/integrase [Spirochaetia bacterium]|jgi:integrase|nr:tyrosine-type recombinase/integrase [Spirochaetia bacterium]
MRYKEPFTLYSRIMKNGKSVYYYRFYDEDGKRTSGKSTGMTSKTAAKNYVSDLIKNGLLSATNDITFKTYSTDWWIWEKCEYIQRQHNKGNSLGQTYADGNRGHLNNHILPFFKSKKLRNISTNDIEKWLMQLNKDEKKHISPTTINNCLKTLKLMLKEAHRLGYISNDPSGSISKFKEKPLSKEILNIEQLTELFKEENIQRLWNNNLTHYTLNLLSASTGMRMGEIQALQVKAVHIGYVEINHSWERKYGLKEPKTKSHRSIPIPAKTNQYLQDLIQQNEYNLPEDFLFYGTNRYKPIDNKDISKMLYKALEGIGVKYEKGVDRTITFHSWRVFFNTVMRDKISDYKLQQLTGHKTQEMTDHYTKFNISDYDDVKALQENLFS